MYGGMPVLVGIAAISLALLTGCGDPVDRADLLGPTSTPELAKGSPNKPGADIPLGVRIPGEVSAPTSDLVGDGAGAYRDGECSVSAVIRNYDASWPEEAYFRFDPVTTRNLRKLNCTPRAYFLQLGPSTPVHLHDDPHEDTTLGELDLVTDPMNHAANVAFLYEFAGTPVGSAATTRGNIAVAFCRGPDGRGAPMRFNPATGPGSDELEVRHVAPDEWQVRTRPFPNNRAWCEHHLDDGTTIELLLHVDLAYDFSEIR